SSVRTSTSHVDDPSEGEKGSGLLCRKPGYWSQNQHKTRRSTRASKSGFCEKDGLFASWLPIQVVVESSGAQHQHALVRQHDQQQLAALRPVAARLDRAGQPALDHRIRAFDLPALAVVAIVLVQPLLHLAAITPRRRLGRRTPDGRRPE